MKDLFGTAILDFQTNNNPENIRTETNISEADNMELSYLFRSFKTMPPIEQKALQLCTGTVLDVGCGAGSHSLHLQNELNLEVLSIDISENAIKTCALRGLKNTQQINILNLKNQKFDTILLLMNGTGIFENLKKTSLYLSKLKSLLKPNGQILLDSSDLIYMYDPEDLQQNYLYDGNYYGELLFTISYKNQTETPFSWLYMDFETLQNECEKVNLKCNLIHQGVHYDYLAQLKL